MADLLRWLDGLGNIGGDVVSAIGTVIAATLGASVGVWTWVLSTRHDARRQLDARLLEAERDRAERIRVIEEDRRQKRERINDIVTALHAEILTGILLYSNQMKVAQVRDAIANLTPFATPDETDFVFESVKSELSILPSEVIHSVVAYYRVTQQTNLIIRDFRDATFKSQSPGEKRKFMEGYISLIVLLKKRGDRAVQALADFAVANDFSLKASQELLLRDTRAAMAEAARLLAKANSAPRAGEEGDARRQEG